MIPFKQAQEAGVVNMVKHEPPPATPAEGTPIATPLTDAYFAQEWKEGMPTRKTFAPQGREEARAHLARHQTSGGSKP